jgi:hypothetical protein
MNRRGFAVIEIFLIAIAMTVVGFLISIHPPLEDQTAVQGVQVAKADNAAIDNTGKRPASFKVWIEKKEEK